MKSRWMLVFAVFAVVAAACSPATESESVAGAELVWCAQVDSSTVFDAIWDAADDLRVDSVGAFLLDRAGIATDVDPRELSPEDLSEEELVELAAVGNEFDASDVLWIEYINSPDGAKACRAAYIDLNG